MNFLKNNSSFRNLLLLSIALLSINQFFLLDLINLSEQTANQAIFLGNAMTLLTISKIIVLPISGFLVDRIKEKKILLLSSIGFIFFFLLVIIQNNLAKPSNHLFLYAIISGILLGFVQPSMYSIIPKIIDINQKIEANSLFQTSSQLSQFIIPTIESFIIGIISKNSYYIFIIGLAFLSLIFAKNISLQENNQNEELNITKNNSIDYKQIIQNKSILSLLILTAVINFSTSGPLQVTLPTFINTELQQNTTIYGYFMSIYGLGSFLGSFISMFMHKKYETLNFLLGLVFIF